MKISLIKDQRGLGHVGVVALIILVVAVAGFAGYRVSQTNDDKTMSVSNSGDPILANCMKLYKDNVLCQFAVKNADLSRTAYTATDTSTDNMSQVTKFVVKNDGKGSVSLSSTAGNTTFNTVSIGNTVYVQQNGNTWIKYTAGAPASVNPAGNLKLDFSTSSTPAEKRVTYKKLGNEKCTGGTCSKYQVLDPLADGSTYIWINNSNYQLERLTTKSADGTNDFRLTYGPVTIVAPSPTITPAEAQQKAIDTDMIQSETQRAGY